MLNKDDITIRILDPCYPPREVKFRAICLEHNFNVVFTLSDLVNPRALFSIRNLVIPWLLDGNIPDEYTGLKDINRREIYEGDIVRDTRDWAKGKISRIRFGMGAEGEPADTTGYYEGWCLGDEDEEVTGFTQGDASYMEVIGNIHKNPRLLEEK